METALIAAAATVAGVLIGHMLSSRSRLRDWVRSEIHIACGDVLAAAEAASELHGWHYLTTSVVKDANDFGRMDENRKSELRRSARRLAREHREQLGDVSDATIDAAIQQHLNDPQREDVALGKFDADIFTIMKGMRDAHKRLNAAVSNLMLLCAADVVNAGRKLADKTHDLRLIEDWNSHYAAFQSARADFIAAARLNLQRPVIVHKGVSRSRPTIPNTGTVGDS